MIPVSMETVVNKLSEHITSLTYSRVTLIEKGVGATFSLVPNAVTLKNTGLRNKGKLTLRLPFSVKAKKALKNLKQAEMSDTTLKLIFPDEVVIFTV